MNELSKKGAQPSKPTRYGVLYNEYFYNGIITQRNPLRGAASHIESEFYGARLDTLYDGLNAEVSSKLTLIRRPGLSVYNAYTYPAINRFYEWSLFNSNTTQIKVMADTASYIYDATGPGTAGTPTPLFTKSAGAGSTYFQSVGNVLYFSDGVDLKKVVGSLTSWAATTSFAQGQFIVDSNGNIQEAIGSQTANLADIQVVAGVAPGPATYVASLFYSPTTPMNIPSGTILTLAGLTTVPSLNGSTNATTIPKNSLQTAFSGLVVGGNPPFTSFSAETGTATTGNGITGSSQPSWATGLGAVTQDGGAQWLNKGPQVENWGIVAPANPPLATQVPAPSVYPDWAASTWYSPNFVIIHAGNAFRLTTAGITGGSLPTFDTTPGHTTTDGSAVWTCLGSATWASVTSYALGYVISVNFTYYITQSQSTSTPPYYELVQIPVTVTLAFQCTTAGTSGSSTPTWTSGNNTTVNDGTVVWTNIGTPVDWPGATQTLNLASKIVVVANGYQFVPQFTKESGSSTPTWNTTVGSITSDNGNGWTNVGPYSPANTGAWVYAYSYVNSVTDTVSTASPKSTPVLVAVGNQPVIQGKGSSDPQVDQIYLWRTVQGGSILFFLDQITNPGSGNTWIYTDTTPDTSTSGPSLNELIEAPIDHANDPPPARLSALTYHLGLIWGVVNNSVYFSAGPFTNSGNGNEAWPPANVFVFPSTVIRLFPTSSGLVVFTVSDIYIIQGLNTSISPLFSLPFLEGIGLVSYDAFAVNGALVFIYSSDNQVLTLDPSSGVSEVGFPIGDQFGTGTFSPSSARVTWHIAGSQDKGLYVSDFTGTWWRMCPTPSPETGTTWSPKAQIVGGFSAVQSVETSSGTHSLLVGPRTSGPILKRNYQVYTDNGSSYPAWSVLGSLVLAQPGQLAEVQSLTTDSVAVGSPISLGVQLDEISSYSGLASAVPNAPGTGYALNDQVSISGGAGGIYKVTGVSGGGVTSLTVIAPGTGYPTSQTGAATVHLTGSGTGLTVNTTSGGLFENLINYVQDPTELEPSITTYAQRFYLSQTQLPAVCRHLQILINWGSDTVRNELLSLSLFGNYDQEM